MLFICLVSVLGPAPDTGGEDAMIGRVVEARTAQEIINDRTNELNCLLGRLRRADLTREQIRIEDGSADDFDPPTRQGRTATLVAHPFYCVRRAVKLHASAPDDGGPARLDLEWLDRFSEVPHHLVWRSDPRTETAVLSESGQAIRGAFHLALYHRVQLEVSYEGAATVVRVFNGPDSRVMTVGADGALVSRGDYAERPWEETTLLPLTDGTLTIIPPGARPDPASARNGEDRYLLSHYAEWFGRVDGVRRDPEAAWQRDLIAAFRGFEAADDEDHPAPPAERLEATRRLIARAEPLHRALLEAEARQLELRAAEARALLGLRAARQRSRLGAELDSALAEALSSAPPTSTPTPTREATP